MLPPLLLKLPPKQLSKWMLIVANNSPPPPGSTAKSPEQMGAQAGQGSTTQGLEQKPGEETLVHWQHREGTGHTQ